MQLKAGGRILGSSSGAANGTGVAWHGHDSSDNDALTA